MANVVGYEWKKFDSILQSDNATAITGVQFTATFTTEWLSLGHFDEIGWAIDVTEDSGSGTFTGTMVWTPDKDAASPNVYDVTDGLNSQTASTSAAISATGNANEQYKLSLYPGAYVRMVWTAASSPTYTVNEFIIWGRKRVSGV